MLSERNDEVMSDAEQPQQQDHEHQSKTVQITLQSASSTHKKTYSLLTHLRPFC